MVAAGIIALVTISEALMPGPLGNHLPVKNPFGVEHAGSVLRLVKLSHQ